MASVSRKRSLPLWRAPATSPTYRRWRRGGPASRRGWWPGSLGGTALLPAPWRRSGLRAGVSELEVSRSDRWRKGVPSGQRSHGGCSDWRPECDRRLLRRGTGRVSRPVDVGRRELVRCPVANENGDTQLNANQTPGVEAWRRRLGMVRYGLPPVRRKELRATGRAAKHGWPAAWPGVPTRRRDRPGCELNFTHVSVSSSSGMGTFVQGWKDQETAPREGPGPSTERKCHYHGNMATGFQTAPEAYI